MMRDSEKELEGLIREVMEQMQKRKYGKKILIHYRSSFDFLTSISQDIGEKQLSERLIETFLGSPVGCSEKWAGKERTHRQRCIQLLTSFAQTGTVDWGRQDAHGISDELKNETLQSELERFIKYMEQKEFSFNTISGYKRIVAYFLLFCEKNGYGRMSDIRMDDVSEFIVSLYRQGRYRPTTIGSSLSGLRMFLSGNAIADYILNERPQGSSDYVFFKSSAPFGQLGTGSIYAILKKMEGMAGTQKENRTVGSRMTRHHAASSMLRAGVPMSDISAALGHRDPNIVTVYLSTDASQLAACTLPLPSERKGGGQDVW